MGSSIRTNRPDITTPSIVRSLSNVKIASIHSSPVACHFVCIDVLGQAWVFGRNESSSLGGGAKSDLFVDENEPKCLTPRTVGSTNHQAKFVTAIIGRNSTLLVDDEGKVYGAGDNKSGQLGLPACPAVANFTKVASLDKSNIVGGSAGGNFTILIAEDGKIYSVRPRLRLPSAYAVNDEMLTATNIWGSLSSSSDRASTVN